MKSLKIITKDLIFKDTNFACQEEVFTFLAEQLYEQQRSDSVVEVKNGFYSREREFSTCIDHEIAIPHCRVENIKNASVAVIVNKNGIPWTDSEEYVKYLFALMIPEENENQIHIRVLAQMAQMIMQESFMESIIKASSSEKIYEIIKSLNEEIK